MAPFADIGWVTSNEALIQTTLMYTLLAFSFQVTLRAGVFSFAGVGFWLMGGYSTAILVQHGWGTVGAISVTLLGCGAIGLLLAVILGRLRGLYLAMATVAFDLLIQSVASVWTDVTGGAQGLYAIPIEITTGALLVMVVVCGAILSLRERGATGRMLEALRADEMLAPSLGIDVVRQRINTSVLSAVLAALSGSVNALMFSVLTPTSGGFGLIVTALTMIVIGGTSSWIGPLLGAIVVTWLPEELTVFGNWWPAVQGLIIVVMVLYARDGLVGLAVRGYGALTQLGGARKAPIPLTDETEKA